MSPRPLAGASTLDCADLVRSHPGLRGDSALKALRRDLAPGWTQNMPGMAVHTD